MKKIVELIIKLEDELLQGLEDLGLDAVALVENPAIELDFLSFNQELFVKPEAGETEDDFIGRCIPELINEGYEQDQAVAVCYNYWQEGFDLQPYVDQTSDLKKKEEMSEEQQMWFSQLSEMGEEYDPSTAVFVDTSRASFSTLQDFLKGISALDILGKTKKDSDAAGETVYRYSGPIAERGFCRAMLRLNKVYRRLEVAQLNTANPTMAHSGGEYSVFNWKGGPNCRHYWEELTMFKSDGRTVFLSHGPVMGSAGQTNNANSPSSLGSVAGNGYFPGTTRAQMFSLEEEQRIVTGPAMVPNKMILRKDEKGMPYYVYFTEKTIKEISEKLFQENKQNMTNAEHNSNLTNDSNTLLESWIVLDPEKDKAAALGFNVPRGTWMMSYKINDDKMWQMVKEGKLRGFSVEGFFIEKADAMRAAEQSYNNILNILNQIDEKGNN